MGSKSGLSGTSMPLAAWLLCPLHTPVQSLLILFLLLGKVLAKKIYLPGIGQLLKDFKQAYSRYLILKKSIFPSLIFLLLLSSQLGSCCAGLQIQSRCEGPVQSLEDREPHTGVFGPDIKDSGKSHFARHASRWKQLHHALHRYHATRGEAALMSNTIDSRFESCPTFGLLKWLKSIDLPQIVSWPFPWDLTCLFLQNVGQQTHREIFRRCCKAMRCPMLLQAPQQTAKLMVASIHTGSRDAGRLLLVALREAALLCKRT